MKIYLDTRYRSKVIRKQHIIIKI